MKIFAICLLALLGTVNAAKNAKLVTFDGAKDTTWNFKELNDPVMGGLSTGTFTVDKTRQVGVFNGTVAVVPKLKAPGFCVAETINGLGVLSRANDASGNTHLMVTLKSSIAYDGFKICLAANTFNPQFACHKADFSVDVSDGFNTIAIPFNKFSNKWSAYTGEATKKCEDDASVCLTDDDLAKISGVSIWAEGHAGDFHLEVKEISAGVVAEASSVSSFVVTKDTPNFENEVNLVTFDNVDDQTTWSWRDLNDPVMGGLSKSSFEIDSKSGVATFSGVCEIVPSLKAPGFCVAETTDGAGVSRFANDASGLDHLLLTVRNNIAYTGFKVSLAADTLNPQFKSHKASFFVDVSDDFVTVAVPFNQFSNDWSPATGLPKVKCEDDNSVCLSQHNLAHISQIEVWAEGVQGKFNLEVKKISAAKKVDAFTKYFDAKTKSTCSGPVQKNLKYHMSEVDDRLANLPIPAPEGETLAEAICCDPTFKPFAEPNSLFAAPDVNLFSQLSSTGQTVFFDSVCGIPLFKAPIGRTFEEFKAETTEHGWPSFRDAEMIKENVIIKDDGEVVSKCGTHLGSNLPDKDGNRYCLDLSCISGNMAI